MIDYAEIIAQLRDHIGYPIPSMRFAAANALEAQARRIAELTGNREAWKGIQEGTARLLQEKEARIAELEAENALLREKLEPYTVKYSSASLAARAALGDKE